MPLPLREHRPRADAPRGSHEDPPSGPPPEGDPVPDALALLAPVGQLLALLAQGVVVVRAPDLIVYRNAAAAGLLAGADGVTIAREVQATARVALRVEPPGPLRAAGAERAPGAPRPLAAAHARELRLGEACLRLHAARLATAPVAPGTTLPPAQALVLLEHRGPFLPHPEDLVARFGLTTREAAVATRLAQGRENASIARKLGISVNTVRHHVEVVLLKLGVPSRAAVAAALLGTYVHTGEHQAPALSEARQGSVADSLRRAD